MSHFVRAAQDALLYYPDHPNPDNIRSLCDAFASLPEVVELVPAYTSILVYYRHHSAAAMQEKLQALCNTHKTTHTPQTIHLPVYYHPEVGADLQRLATHTKLSLEQVIALHSQKTYQVYAVGFAPAFAYLGMVDKAIAMPRLDSPRPHIAPGSVGIANQQTAVYPIASPAGWNIIGRSPLDLSPARPENLTRFRIGDQVIFEPISRSEFLAQGGTL